MPNLTPGTLREIVATYERYGWVLRRLALTATSKSGLANEIAAGITVTDSSIDAAWFSRPPQDGEVAWELRYLGEIQYALLEYVDENAPGFEEKLAAVEERLATALRRRSDA